MKPKRSRIAEEKDKLRTAREGQAHHRGVCGELSFISPEPPGGTHMGEIK